MQEEYLFLNMNIKFLRIFAMYPIGKNASFWKKSLYCFSKYISITFTYIMAIPVCLSLVLNHQDIVQIALNTLNIGIYISSALTMHILQNGKDTLQILIYDVNKTFKEESYEGVQKVSMKKTNKFVKLLTLYWYVAITICAQLMAFSPIYSNKTDERILAVPSWYPFEWKNSSIRYTILFIIQCLGQFNLTNIYGMADTFILSFLLLTGKQMELLGYNFENCVYTTLFQHGFSQNAVARFGQTFNVYGMKQINDYANVEKRVPGSEDEIENIYNAIKSKQFEKRLLRNVYKSIKHHIGLLNVIKKLETFIWPLMFVKITASMSYHILICFMIVFSTNETFLYTLGQYEVMAIYELLLISYFGQYLINQGEKFRQQVYNCPWYISNKDVQNSIRLVLLASTRPPRLTVAKLADLSLGTFLAIMKTSTSYFTVLRQTVQR